METWKKYISAIVFICGFAVLPSYAFSAAASQEHGVVLTGEAKQDYIQKEMNALYHPSKNTPAKPWTQPKGWVYEKLAIGDVPVALVNKNWTQKPKN